MEELAGIVELLHTLAQSHGVSIEKIEQIRKEKAEKHGALNEKIFLIEVKDD